MCLKPTLLTSNEVERFKFVSSLVSTLSFQNLIVTVSLKNQLWFKLSRCTLDFLVGPADQNASLILMVLNRLAIDVNIKDMVW